jgi:ankyrin repeat protein
MTTPPVPLRPSLEFDRKQAKALLDAARAGDARALERFRAHHPRLRGAEARGAALHDAQLVVAREYGFASWPRWKHFAEARRLDAAGRAAEIARAACTEDVRKASTLLAAEPELAAFDLYTAYACGAPERVERLLTQDASLARRRGGPLDREPILYACFSRFLRSDRPRAEGIVRAVRLLLERGADPDAHFLVQEGAATWRQTALFGAAGIANDAELTRMLLAAGADADELGGDPGTEVRAETHGTEALYHACEFADVTCLRLLLEARPHPRRVSYALARMLDFENPAGVELLLRHGADADFRIPWMHDRTHLHRAVVYGRSVPIVRMLLAAGADPNARDARGATPLRYAVRHGREELAELLREAGADDSIVTDADRAAGAAAAGKARPGRPAPIDPDVLCNAACRDDAPLIRTLLAAGADPDAAGGLDETPPLHWACWRGCCEAAAALVEGGADLHAVNRYGGTPSPRRSTARSTATMSSAGSR